MLNFRWFSVWLRNFNVWMKLLIPSLLGNFGDPLIYLLALGYGFGHFIGQMDGMPYLVFLASGIVCSSAMNAASFEGMFSAYTRLSSQKTWEGMLSAPLSVEDIVFGETMWASTKGLFNASAILIVSAILGLVKSWLALWILPIIFLMSMDFSVMALAITAVARGYDFFTYYLTLIVTPMMLLSGVFFPLDKMPKLIQYAAQLLPLHHAVALVRPLMTGGTVSYAWVHLLVLLLYATVFYFLTVKLTRKRLIS